MLLTVKQVCNQLSIGRILAYRLIKEGELQMVKLHGRTLMTRESIEQLVKAKTG